MSLIPKIADGWMFPADPFFDDWTTKYGRPSKMLQRMSSEMQMPRFPLSVDVHETEKEYQFKCDIPGMDEKDIKVSCDDNLLTIEGERKDEKTTEEKNVRRVERSFGHFRRQFSLPGSVDSKATQAHYENGVLNVNVPKATKSEAKRVPVTKK
eukprot:Rmarinus@m.23434